MLALVDIFTVPEVWRRGVTAVAGAHVGPLQVGARPVPADPRIQALIHIQTLPAPASESFRAGHTAVGAGCVHALLIWTRAGGQTLVDVLTAASPGHAVATAAVLTVEGAYCVDAMACPTHLRLSTLVHVYAVGAFLVGHEACWADAQETAFGVFTAAVGAEVWDLCALVNINTFSLLVTERIALVANAGIPHWKVDAMSSSTDIGVHSTFIDFCHLSRCDHLAGT